MSRAVFGKSEFVFIGLASAITQAVFLRQLVGLLGSSEILYAMIVTIWLVEAGVFSLLCGYIARRNSGAVSPLRRLAYGVLIILPLYYFVVPTIRGFFGGDFGTVPISGATVISSAVLIPPSLFAGGAFALVWEQLRKRGSRIRVDTSYALDSIGFALGGLLITFIFAAGAYDLFLLFFCALGGVVTLATGVWMRAGRLLGWIVALASVVLLIMVLLPGLNGAKSDADCSDAFVYSKLVTNDSIQVKARSPYGHATLRSAGESVSFYYNSQRIATVPDPSEQELAVLAAVMAADPVRSLIIGNPVDGKSLFLANATSMRVTQLEVDPSLCSFFEMQLAHRLRQGSRERFDLVMTAPSDFLLDTEQRFDLIYLNYSEVSSSATSVYFSREFFELVRATLRRGGVFAFSLEAGENFIPDERLKLLKNIQVTLNRTFDSVLIVPGQQAMFLAGDSESRLTLNAGPLLARVDSLARGTQFLPAYLADRVSEFRVAKLNDLLGGVEGELLHSGKPDQFLLNSILEMDRFGGLDSSILRAINGMSGVVSTAIAVVPISVLLLIGVLYRRGRAVPLLFSAGWLSMSAEVLVLVLYQTVAGNLYSRIALITGAFMVGITLGAILAARLKGTTSRFAVAIALLIAGLLTYSAALGSPLFTGEFGLRLIVESSLIALSLALGLVSGFVFNRSVLMHEHSSGFKAPGFVYGLDLIGAAIGGATSIVIILPVLGISAGFWIIGSVSLVMGAYSLQLDR